MTVRRIAVNRIVADGREEKQCIAELDADGLVVSWHTFSGELPFTEWRGGTLRLVRLPDGRYRIED